MTSVEVKKIHTLTGHKDCLYTLAAVDDHSFLSAGGDGMVVLWDLHDADTGQMIVKVPSSVYAMAYQPSRELLVVGQNFDGIHLIDLETKSQKGSLSLTKSAIFDIQTADDSIWIADGDGTLFRVGWDLRIINRRKQSMKSARTISLHSSRNELAVGYSDNRIRIFDAESLELKTEIDAHKISVFSVRYHPRLSYLISGSRDARIKLWDIDDNYGLKDEIPAHMYTINHIAFSPSGQHFVTCSMDKSIKVWDSHSFRLLKVIDKARHAGHGTSVNKLLWMPYNNWLISCSDDRTLSVWDINFKET